MSQSYDAYGKVANEFIQQVRQHSPAAADCLEQIRTQYGERAAYLAAFALVIFAGRNRNGFSSFQEELQSFTYYQEMQGDAEALRLYQEAAGYLQSA